MCIDQVQNIATIAYNIAWRANHRAYIAFVDSSRVIYSVHVQFKFDQWAKYTIASIYSSRVIYSVRAPIKV